MSENQKLDLLRRALGDWLSDRALDDPAAKTLAATFLSIFPEEAHTVERCSCGEPCDECPTEASTKDFVEQHALRGVPANA